MSPRDTSATASAPSYSAFIGDKLVHTGALIEVVTRAKKRAVKAPEEQVLFFEDESGKQLELSLDGTVDEIVARALPEPPPAGRGRPKLGVTSGEVTLLPRHWEWLEQQPNGISAALRRLVDEARKREPDVTARRCAQEAAHRFMTAMAGDRRGYEEALRALYAGERSMFHHHIEAWPRDIRKFAAKLADGSFSQETN